MAVFPSPSFPVRGQVPALQPGAPGAVWFVGAGPGDPDLITLKGRQCLAAAEFILYAGSLVPPALLRHARPTARVVDSSPLTLEESHALLRDAARSGQSVVRLHTGDPSIYGTLREQTRLLDADGIAWAVVPGVTAACAAAAAAGISFSVPEVTQSLILTRLAGRTPVPERERLRALAAHGSSLAIYLSSARPEALQEELCAVLPGNTPVICAHRVGWPDACCRSTTLEGLAECVREYRMEEQTLFLVLPGQQAAPTCSRLYDAAFSHACRQGKD